LARRRRLLAGRLSGDKVELGRAARSIGLGVFSLLLLAVQSNYWAPRSARAAGVSGGFFAVPLNALSNSDRPRTRRTLLATNNVLNNLGMLASAAFSAAGRS
jgi:hypothetical protein